MGQERVVWLAEKREFGWNIFFGGKNIYALSSRAREQRSPRDDSIDPDPTVRA